jgi:hypothetical protein
VLSKFRQRKPGTKLDKRKGGRYAGRVRLAIVLDRSADSLCGFVDSAITPGTQIITVREIAMVRPAPFIGERSPVGFVVGAKRDCTAPALSTKTFVKFHFIG